MIYDVLLPWLSEEKVDDTGALESRLFTEATIDPSHELYSDWRTKVMVSHIALLICSVVLLLLAIPRPYGRQLDICCIDAV